MSDVAGDRAIGNRQICRAENAAAVAEYVAAGQRKAADRHISAGNAEDAAAVTVVDGRRRIVATSVDRQEIGPRTVDGKTPVDRKLAKCQFDRAAGGAVDRFT